MNAARDRQGFTLWEMLVYCVISAAILNICVVTFIQTSRVASLSTERAMRQQAYAQFTRDFTRTVRSASRVLPGIGATVTNESQVVLDTPEGPVIIGMVGDKPAIWGVEPSGDAWRVRRITSYPIAVSLRFELDSTSTDAARRVTVRVMGPPRKDPEDVSNLRVLVAALRVDGVWP